MDKTKVAVVLRFFEGNLDKAGAALARLDAYMDEAGQYPAVYAAINVEQDTSGALAHLKANYPQVTVIPVQPWNKFVFAMNALTYQVALDGHEVLFSASAEFPPKREFLDPLLAQLDDDTLQVGARFAEHIFEPGAQFLTGANCPWNTFCIWNLRHLAKFGFILAGDGPFNQKMAGVEEVATVALHQERRLLSGFPAYAKLVSIPGFFTEWNMDGWDDARREAHAKKIQSKADRPNAQLAWAGLPQPTVLHIG